MNDVTHRKRGLRLEKSQLVEFCLGGRRLTFARLPRPCGRCRTSFGGDGKVSIERGYLSPYVEKPFNSKVIKSFVPEVRSRKCFCVSGYLCYIWTFYEHYMYVSHIPVCLCYILTSIEKKFRVNIMVQAVRSYMLLLLVISYPHFEPTGKVLAYQSSSVWLGVNLNRKYR